MYHTYILRVLCLQWIKTFFGARLREIYKHTPSGFNISNYINSDLIGIIRPCSYVLELPFVGSLYAVAIQSGEESCRRFLRSGLTPPLVLKVSRSYCRLHPLLYYKTRRSIILLPLLWLPYLSRTAWATPSIITSFPFSSFPAPAFTTSFQGGCHDMI